MSLPKIKDFTDFNHYPSDPQPTTDADMQDYMLNQNDILAALTKRLWQPQTEYKLGDIVASDAMADGLVAVCTVAGVTSDIEPEWGVNEAAVIDNSCTWIMRPAYCYGLATEGDIDTAYEGGSVENSRLMSMGIFSRLMACVEKKIRLLAYPVGSIYMSMSATNPAELFGGTWEQIAQGRCLIGAGTGTDSRSESKTFTAGATGGEYNHVLTVGELAAHNHSASLSNTNTSYLSKIEFSNGKSYSSSRTLGTSGTSGWAQAGEESGGGLDAMMRFTNSLTAHGHTVTVNNNGSGTAHNNLPPYLGLYVWKRTA